MLIYLSWWFVETVVLSGMYISQKRDKMGFNNLYLFSTIMKKRVL